MFKQLFKSRQQKKLNKLPLFPTLADLIQSRNNQQFLSKIEQKPNNLLQNQNSSNHYGNGMEFAEVRHYQPGDEVRNIDWKVTARTNQPHTKLFIEEKERNVYFCLDQSTNLNFGTTVCLKSFTLCKIAATLAWHYCHEQQKISGLFFKNNNNTDYCLLKPMSRNKGVMQLLQSFIDHQNKSFEFQHDNTCYLKKILIPLASSPPGSKIIILSDFACSSIDSFKKIATLKKNKSISCYHIYDPIEKHWPQYSSDYCITNGEKSLSININEKFIKQYESTFNQKVQLFEQECHKLNIEYALLENNQSLYNTLLLHSR